MNPEWDKTQRFPHPQPNKKHLDIAFALENLQIIADQELLERGGLGVWHVSTIKHGELESQNQGKLRNLTIMIYGVDMWFMGLICDLWGWYVIYEYVWLYDR